MFVFDENFGHGQVFLFVLLYTELYYLNIIRNIMEIKMNLKQAGVLTIAVVWSLGVQARGGKRLSEYVNPFIGATTNTQMAKAEHGLGKTFPGVATPWGMTQVSPNTITGGDNGSGYSYEHTTIEGFALTQMSGVGWYGDLGNYLVMPTTGPLHTYRGEAERPEEGYRSRYDKESETARAGYYAVRLTDYDIRAELTATPHGGVMRFTYPENECSRIQIDLARRVGGTSVRQYVERVDDYTIRGWMRCTPDGGGWGNGGGKADYTVYFYTRFSKPLERYGVWSAEFPEGMGRKLENVTSPEFAEAVRRAKVTERPDRMEGDHLGFYTEFPTRKGEQVLMRTAISFVSLGGAEANFKAELQGEDFERYCEKAAELWDEALSKIKIFGGTEDERTIFYTSLYHTMIDPRDYRDVTGEYVGGDRKVHKTDAFKKRTVFSGWDVFRSQFPLQNLINPEVVNDMINSFVTLAEENGTGVYERWEFLNAYSGCMLGNPAIAVIVDAYMKGIRGYDVEKAYRFARQTGIIRNWDIRPAAAAYRKRWNTDTSIGVWANGPRLWARRRMPASITGADRHTVKSSIRKRDGSACATPTARGRTGRKRDACRSGTVAWSAIPINRVGSCRTTCPAWWKSWAVATKC